MGGTTSGLNTSYQATALNPFWHVWPSIHSSAYNRDPASLLRSHHSERFFFFISCCCYTNSQGYQPSFHLFVLIPRGPKNLRCFRNLCILEMDALPDDERCEVADRAGPDGAESRELNGAKHLRIVWRNVILMSMLHTGALYSLLLIPKAHPFTWIWCKYENEVNTLGYVC